MLVLSTLGARDIHPYLARFLFTIGGFNEHQTAEGHEQFPDPGCECVDKQFAADRRQRTDVKKSQKCGII